MMNLNLLSFETLNHSDCLRRAKVHVKTWRKWTALNLLLNKLCLEYKIWIHEILPNFSIQAGIVGGGSECTVLSSFSKKPNHWSK